MNSQVYCHFIWTKDGWKKKIEYKDDGSDDIALRITFEIRPNSLKYRYRLPSPDIHSLIHLLNVRKEHLLMTIIDDNVTLMRPYLSFQIDYIRMGHKSLNIGNLRFELEYLSIQISDSRQIITFN